MKTTSSVNRDSILELINQEKYHARVEWTARQILNELGIEASTGHKKTCKKILRDLWIEGLLKRKASFKDNLEVAFCRPDVVLNEYCVPCENCFFPIHVRGSDIGECIRCHSGSVGSGNPAKIYYQ